MARAELKPGTCVGHSSNRAQGVAERVECAGLPAAAADVSGDCEHLLEIVGGQVIAALSMMDHAQIVQRLRFPGAVTDLA